MKKIIIHSFAIIIYFSISACGNSVSFPSITPTPSSTYTPIPSVTPSPSPTSSTPEVPALVKTSLEFYRNGKIYEIIVGYSVGNAFRYATPEPAFPMEKWEKAGASSAEFERYGDFDNDGEMEFIVSLMYCGAYCSETIQIYEYDIVKDTYYVADEFGAKYPAVADYKDIDNNGSLEIITSNYGFCPLCGGAAVGFSALTILRYENGRFIDVTTEFPELIQKNADSALKLAKENEQDIAEIRLSTYMYDMYRLGKIDEARPIFEQICNSVVKPIRSSPDNNFDCAEFQTKVERYIREFKIKS